MKIPQTGPAGPDTVVGRLSSGGLRFDHIGPGFRK